MKRDLKTESFLVDLSGGRSVALEGQVAHLLVEGRHALELRICDNVGRWCWPTVHTSKHQLGANNVLDTVGDLETRMEHIMREEHCSARSRTEVKCWQLQRAAFEILVKVNNHRVDAALTFVVGIHAITMFRKVLTSAISSDAEARVQAHWFPSPFSAETHGLQEVDVSVCQVRCQSHPQCTSKSLAEMNKSHIVPNLSRELPLHVASSKACRLGGSSISCCLRLREKLMDCEASWSQVFALHVRNIRKERRWSRQWNVPAPSVVDRMYTWWLLLGIRAAEDQGALLVAPGPRLRRMCPL
mmetsp:Transcript_46298/g.122907  ORF Transcript_46298/g.122907 Transcript_46298/m.122907 type:complete len:300 (+) Transcript_46298:1899-2798(+)